MYMIIYNNMNLSEWLEELEELEVKHILEKEFKRREALKKYSDSDKGKLARKLACRKYYLKRKYLGKEATLVSDC